MSDPRINYTLLEGETLLTCPYNKSHAVLPLKFPKHVIKCHDRHLMEQEEKGEESLFGICQYDRAHHVPKEELEHHEATCETRKKYSTWEDWDQCKEDEAKAAATGIVEGAGVEVVYRRPPPDDCTISEKTKKLMEEAEEWDSDPKPMPDIGKHLHELRLKGHRIPNMQDIIGKSKGDKKKYYDAQTEAAQVYKEHLKTQRLRQNKNPDPDLDEWSPSEDEEEKTEEKKDTPTDPTSTTGQATEIQPQKYEAKDISTFARDVELIYANTNDDDEDSEDDDDPEEPDWNSIPEELIMKNKIVEEH